MPACVTCARPAPREHTEAGVTGPGDPRSGAARTVGPALGAPCPTCAAVGTLAVEGGHAVMAGGAVEAGGAGAVVDVLAAVLARPAIDAHAVVAAKGVVAGPTVLAGVGHELALVHVLGAVLTCGAPRPLGRAAASAPLDHRLRPHPTGAGSTSTRTPPLNASLDHGHQRGLSSPCSDGTQVHQGPPLPVIPTRR